MTLTAADIDTLHRKRGVIQRRITTFEKILDEETAAETANIELIDTALQGVVKSWSKFDNIQLQLETISRAKKLIKKGTVVAVNTTTENIQNLIQTMSVKLPQIQLISFSGAYEEWSSFFNNFTSLVHNNPSISPSQKLQYLRSALQGRAARAIQSLKTTNANYECTRKIVRRHWAALRELPRLHKDTLEALGELVDAFNQHLRSMRNLGEPIDKWNTPSIDLIITKISVEPVLNWELTLKDQRVPSYKGLLDYLEKKASCSDSPSATSSNNSNINKLDNKFSNNYKRDKNFTPHRQAFTTMNFPLCKICKQNHKIYHCLTFFGLPVEQRIQAVQRKGLCFTCLHIGHTASKCTAGKCHKCSKKHNTLIHRSQNIEKVVNVPSDKTTQPVNNEKNVQQGTALSILCVGQINLSSSLQGELYLQKTRLGWLIGGSQPTKQVSKKHSCHVTSINLDKQLTKFWEIEKASVLKQTSQEDIECENHFKENVMRDENGRYMVALPFNHLKSKLGESKTMAMRRLQGMQRKL
ncbi:uncharacterized protein LOC130673818 [Microplitis mediator]|uniref:uncharacterized protein LOC130673818 n=1 Tax=Microplitis mediator TaxID=375433 RepID=UPI0025556EE0|nr:uncharacterized protein LOC130673818 [Microplitis mediator]